MGAAAHPMALLDATAELISVGPGLSAQLDAGLRSLLRLLGADRGDVGLLSPASPAYRPARLAALTNVPVTPFALPAGDPMIRAVLGSPRAAAVGDVAAEVADGPTRALLMGNGTTSIVVRRIDHHDDGWGLVCLDWVGRTVDLPDDALELVDYFVARIWSPLLLRSRAEGNDRVAVHRLAPLTRSERAVVELAAAGLSYREIATERRASVNTVAQQLRSARHKAGVRNTAELCALVGPGSQPVPHQD